MKAFIRYIYHTFLFNWHRRSNKSFCKYLKNGGVSLGRNVNFRYPRHTTIDSSRPYLIEIGDNVDINDNFTIMTHDFSSFVFRNLYHDFVPSSGKVKIGSNIYFGRDVTILKGVTIGDNCIIGLGSIVTKNIPSNSVACGTPCKVICTLEEYYKKRKTLSVNESIELGRIIVNKLNRTPQITDFKEEWSLFFREQDFINHPEMHKIIDWRLKCDFKKFRDMHNVVFDGFDKFLAAVKTNLD